MSKPIGKFDPEKFWSELVDVPATECRERQKTQTKDGYSRVWIHPKLIYAHRIAWELTHGPIINGLHVLHKCDNPPCCNPDHLFLGTAKDNALDKVAKGRGRNGMIRGTDHTLSKLTERDVLEIRKNYRPGRLRKNKEFTTVALAKKYGVAHSLIHRIITGQSWPHVGGVRLGGDSSADPANRKPILIAP